MGILSPAGNDLESYWRGITCGRSAIRKIRRFDTMGMPIQIGGEVDDDDFASDFSDAPLRRMDRAVMFGMVAAGRALESASISEEMCRRMPIGALIGSGLGPAHHAEEAYAAFCAKGWRAVRPTTIPRVMYNSIASHISIRYHLTGGHHVVAAACSSSSLAIAEAFECVRTGREDVVLTGGCDSPMVPSIYGAWVNLRILSRNPEPEKASRPFDRNRDGLVLSEGAAMFVFEEMTSAVARGARIFAEVLGSGGSSDASHITRPSAEGQALALRRALENADLAPGEVDYINAHGTSTLLNDVTETEAIKRAFGKEAKRVPISSTKSVIGHAMGASGSLELVATILALNRQVLPPTVNLDEPDPKCDLDYVPKEARPAPLRVALSNSFGFGGSNSVLAVKSFEG